MMLISKKSADIKSIPEMGRKKKVVKKGFESILSPRLLFATRRILAREKFQFHTVYVLILAASQQQVSLHGLPGIYCDWGLNRQLGQIQLC